MYEHPSLTITAIVDERARMDREIERRRAILERLDASSAPRPRWRDRLRSMLRPARAREADAAAARTAVGASVASAGAPDAAAGILDAGILMVPAR